LNLKEGLDIQILLKMLQIQVSAQNSRLIISITLFQVTVVLNLEEAAGAVVAAGVV